MSLSSWQFGWRFMILVAAFFALAVEVGITFIPNSPRWLVLKSLRSQSLLEVDEHLAAEAKEALAFFRGTSLQARSVLVSRRRL